MKIDYEYVLSTVVRGRGIDRCGDGGEEFPVGCFDGFVVLVPFDILIEVLVVREGFPFSTEGNTCMRTKRPN